MVARAHRHRGVETEAKERLAARIAELEQRLKLLEARVRSAQSPRSESPATRRPGRSRPRCPGCLLELPRGRRGESCVWCGFYFEAARSRRTP